MNLNALKFKKVFLVVVLICLAFNLYSNPKQSSQIIKTGHWIYDDLTLLSTESKTPFFLETQPLSVGELRFYFESINYENLSSSGKKIYKRVADFLDEEDDFFPDSSLRLFLNGRVNPEFMYKSNKDIPWSFLPNVNYKDNPLTLPIIIGFSDNLTIESDLTLGRTLNDAKKPKNFTNIFVNGAFDMYITRFAYFSGVKVFDDWGISAHMGKEGMKIGNTGLGSVLYNDTFNSDFYVQLNLFTSFLKYTMAVNQFDNEKYMYIHQVTFKPFKNFSLGVLEGSLIQAPFELRYLNPLMVMHQMEGWRDYDKAEKEFYGESNFCAYLGFTFEYMPIRNMRIYGLYAQNEILDFGDKRTPKNLSMPDSIGAQLGVEYFIPFENNSTLKTRVEAQYTSPYLYVKHSPRWSLIKTKRAGNDFAMQSWLGSPLGPDSFKIQAAADYDSNEKWTAGFEYNFTIHGENTADNLFSDGYYKNFGTEEKPNYKWVYYPSVQYELGEKADDQNMKDAAVKNSRDMWMHGTPEYKNEIVLKGNYKVLDNLELSARFGYSFIFNSLNKSGNFDQGVEMGIMATYDLF